MASRSIRVEIVGDASKFQAGLRKASNESDHFAHRLNVSEKATHAFRNALGLAAGAAGLVGIVEGIKSVVKEAAAHEKVQAAMQAQLKAVRIEYGKYRGEIDQTLAAQSKLSAFDDEDLQRSFTGLVRTTKDVGNALRLNALASDIARGKHMDLQTSATLVGKVYAGNVGVLGRYGIAVAKGTTSTQALALLQERFAGQAKAFGDTSEGAYQRFEVSIDNAKEALGVGLIPELTKAGNAAAEFLNREDVQRNLREFGETVSVEVGEKLGEISDWVGEHEEELANLFRGAEKASRATAKALGEVLEVSDKVAESLGGWENVLTVAVGVAAVGKVTKLAGAFGLLRGKTGANGVGGAGILGATGALVGLGVGIDAVLQEQVPKLDGALGSIAKFLTSAHGIGFGTPWGAAAMVAATLTGGGGGGGGSKTLPSGTGALAAITGNTPQGSSIATTAAAIGGDKSIVYDWGGRSAQTGYDCSGFVQDMYKRQGISVPGDTRSQWNDPTAVVVPAGQEQPGDAVYFVGSLSGKNAGPPPGHVGIYLGGGRYISFFSQGKPAGTGSLSSRSDYMGARRWLKIGTSSRPSAPPFTGGSGAVVSPFGTGKKATGGGAAAPIVPLGLQIAQAKAALTPTLTDDLAAALNIKTDLVAASKKAKGERQLEILQAIKSITDDIVGIRAKIGDAAQAAANRIAKNDPASRANREGFSRQIVGAANAASAAAFRTAKAQMLGLDKQGDTSARAMTKALLGIDPDTVISTVDQFGNTLTTQTAASLLRKVQEMWAKLENAKTPQQKKNALANLLGLSDQVISGVQTNTAKAQEAFGKAQTSLLNSFNRQTQAHLKSMAAQLNVQLRAVDAELQGTLAGIDARLRESLLGIEQARAILTPAEKQLQELTAAHDRAGKDKRLADAQKAVQDATLGGDPEAILQAKQELEEELYQRQVDDLTQRAQLERTEADRRAGDLVSAAQAASDGEKTAAQAAADARRELIQSTYDAAVEAYQAEREAQAEALNEMLAYYVRHLDSKNEETKKKAIELYNWWLAHPEYGAPPIPNPAGGGGGGGGGTGGGASNPTGAPAGSNNPDFDPSDLFGIRPMARGGSGIVTRPTLFLAGEAGNERFNFEPLSGASPAASAPTTYVDLRGSTFLGTSSETKRELARMLEPYLGKTVQVVT